MNPNVRCISLRLFQTFQSRGVVVHEKRRHTDIESCRLVEVARNVVLLDEIREFLKDLTFAFNNLDSLFHPMDCSLSCKAS